MAKKNSDQNSNESGAKSFAAGVGLAIAAAAGAYFLYGTKSGAKQRKKIHGWTLKAKGEVLEKLEQLKEINETAYQDIVDKVTQRYQAMKNIDPQELQAFVQDLKSSWKHIRKGVKGKPAKSSRKKKIAVPPAKA
ncbi:MAG: hypothetical protein HYV77_00190 [Candidatus Wildermuthbacteria bacterium]|nr:hypothetical protein [Candidatus Wildermuthbacteria bacterium]